MTEERTGSSKGESTPRPSGEDTDLEAAFKALRFEEIGSPDVEAIPSMEEILSKERGRGATAQAAVSARLRIPRWGRWATLAAAGLVLSFFVHARWFGVDARLDRIANRYAESPAFGRFPTSIDSLWVLPRGSEPPIAAESGVARWASELRESIEILRSLEGG